MTPIKVTIHRTGTGPCVLTGKDTADGLTVTFEDGTVKEAHLSWRSFKQLLALKCAQGPQQETKPAPMVSGNGPALVAAKS